MLYSFSDCLLKSNTLLLFSIVDLVVVNTTMMQWQIDMLQQKFKPFSCLNTCHNNNTQCLPTHNLLLLLLPHTFSFFFLFFIVTLNPQKHVKQTEFIEHLPIVILFYPSTTLNFFFSFIFMFLV